MTSIPAVLVRALPIQAAPMAGASTPELAAAVSAAGGLGLIAAGYQTVAAMAEQIARVRTLTGEPFGINVFSPQPDRTAELATQLAGYRARLVETADRYGVQPGRPTWDDDLFDAKVARLLEDPVPVVTFTFGPVASEVVGALQRVGSVVGFTVTSGEEARAALALGADFLVAQGHQAGGHRGTWNVSDEPNRDDAATVTSAAIAATGLPTVAAGGVDGPEAVQALLDAGACAVAVGTLFVAADESTSAPAHKDALTSDGFAGATVTRAFSGRFGRALVNEFVTEHDGAAPAAYPNVHRMTTVIRAAAARQDDPQGMALWAGSGHRAAVRAPAATILAALSPT